MTTSAPKPSRAPYEHGSWTNSLPTARFDAMTPA